MRIDPTHAAFLRTLETPALIIDGAALDANIAAAAVRARAASVTLRPHVKTHKSIEIARRQMAAGAEGITVATPAEACVFLEAGVPSVTIARPIVRVETASAPLAIAAAKHADLRFTVDSVVALQAVAGAAAAVGRSAAVYVEIDVGHRRCGLDPTDDAVAALFAAIDAERDVHAAGLLSHAGHAYAARKRAELLEIAAAERAALIALADRIQAGGSPRPPISVGTTPTLHAEAPLDGVDEIRPGNYVFNDRMQLRLAPDARLALGVLARVISVGAGRAVLDAGSKALSSDQGAHGQTGLDGFGLAQRLDRSASWTLTRLSEEHGVIDLGRAPPPTVGEALIVTPNHACVAANLFSEAVELRSDGATARIAVDARR